jgi:hypothetical protein
MSEVILISITKEELINIIRSTFIELHPTDSSANLNEKPITQGECLEFLGISAPTLKHWRDLGIIPYEKPFPTSRKVRYYKSQLKQAMLQNPHLLKKKF